MYGHDNRPDRVPTAKQVIRERMWQMLESSGISPQGRVFHRIPDFSGSGVAAARLDELSEWRNAHVVKANPDRAQLPARIKAIAEGKYLYMAVPKLASPGAFYEFPAGRFASVAEEVATAEGAKRAAVPTVEISDMKPVDLVVCGTVVADRQGVRIGKGAGYSDIEVGLLAEAGLISARTTILTTVHSLQVVDYELPSEAHDFTVDYILTEEGIITCQHRYRPSGLVWSSLTEEQIAAIPVLTMMRESRWRTSGPGAR